MWERWGDTLSSASLNEALRQRLEPGWTLSAVDSLQGGHQGRGVLGLEVSAADRKRASVYTGHVPQRILRRRVLGIVPSRTAAGRAVGAVHLWLAPGGRCLLLGESLRVSGRRGPDCGGSADSPFVSWPLSHMSLSSSRCLVFIVLIDPCFSH